MLTSFGYVPTSHRGSHVRLRYENKDTGTSETSMSRCTTRWRSESSDPSQTSVALMTSMRGVWIDETVVSDRTDASQDALDKHYHRRSNLPDLYFYATVTTPAYN